MRNICGIFLITLANLILLAHVMVPHTHCENAESENHSHSHDHNHGHQHDHNSQEHSDFGHFFCTIEHVEEDFCVKQYSDLQLVSSISHIVLVYSLFKPFEISPVEKKVYSFHSQNNTIYYSPHLIRSGEKAPPIA